MGQMGPGAGANMFGPGMDAFKQFNAEAENIEVLAHHSLLDGIENRLLESL
jgi:ER membrane protein complex subunit 3